MTTLKVVLIKPSKYGIDGYVERFETGFMPNATLYHIAGLTPNKIDSVQIVTHIVDEYIKNNLDYFELLQPSPDQDSITLVALVGVQSHQFHRALDLAAIARHKGVKHCIIGGPHPMTCDTTQFHNLGVSFALAEAEVIWDTVLNDAINGELRPVYGEHKRWADTITGPIVKLPNKDDLEHYILPSLGLYPARGCPYNCKYCSVIKISGRQLRNAPIDCTLENIRHAKEAGIQYIMFVSDNFNKYRDAVTLLEQMIRSGLTLPFFCQCDTQVAQQSDFINLLGKAGCYEMFIGVESFNKSTLREMNKFHNKPDTYNKIIQHCNESGIQSHFSNIIGFPSDTEESIAEQLNAILTLNPSLSSFYIFTPIPGTDQYEEYKADGLLVENNIDRYDATCLTWNHPNITSGKMSDLLYRCYMEFYNGLLKSGHLSDTDKTTILTLRHYAKQHMHPMSGGTRKKNIDRDEDYIALRRRYFAIELAPLPDNLQLPSISSQ